MPETLALFLMHGLEKGIREGFRTRDGHLLLALADRSDVGAVTVFERPPTVPELVAGRGTRSSTLRKAVAEHPGLSKVSVHPWWSSAIAKPLVMRRKWWVEAYQEEQVTRRGWAGARERLTTCDRVISWVPSSSAPLAGLDCPVHFDLLDNWLVHPQLGQRQDALRQHYASMLRLASSVSANGRGTAELAASFGRSAEVIYNGVDPGPFAQDARTHATTWLRRLNQFPRPWLMYAGKLQERLDVPLLVRLLQELNPGTVFLAGPVMNRAWIRPLVGRRSVVMLGDVNYRQLPGLLIHADVALIPHRVGSGEVGGDVLKQYEYAALGLRAVSTRISGWDHMPSNTHVAFNGEEFVAAVIRLGIDERDIEQRLGDANVDVDWQWSAKAEALMRQII